MNAGSNAVLQQVAGSQLVLFYNPELELREMQGLSLPVQCGFPLFVLFLFKEKK